LSPDGTLIAFTWADETFSNPPALYVKQIGLGAPLRLTTDPAWHGTPAWSPDGRQIAFVQGTGPAESDGVYVMPALGGAKRRLSAVSRSGLDWSPDGAQLALAQNDAAEPRVGIVLVGVDGGPPRRVTTPPAGGWQDGRPVFSPDGLTLAFVRSDTDSLVSDLHVVAASGGAPRRITRDKVPIQGLAWTTDGREIVFDSERTGVSRLWRVDALGSRDPELIGDVGDGAAQPTIARRGAQLAYCRSQVDNNLWQRRLAPNAVPAALLASRRSEIDPQYSPDGSRLTYASNQTGAYEIWVAGAEGSSPQRLTSFNGPAVGTPRWSPDGRRIVFDARVDGTAALYVIDAQGGRPQRISGGDAQDMVPSWSRDGRRIYFTSLRTSRHEIWTMAPDGGGATQITSTGGFGAAESPDGKFLYYAKASSDTSLWRVPLAQGAVTGGEENVVPGDKLLNWADWAPANDGVYYVEAVRQAVAGGALCVIRRLTLPGRRIVDVQRIDRPVWFGLTVAPAGDALLWTQLDHNSSEIIVAANFR
jgi:Tol biopolymer transport system component